MGKRVAAMQADQSYDSELKTDPKISLVIPVYNEQDNILNLFNEIKRTITEPYFAYIIYDSDDDTTLIHRDFLEAQHSSIKFVKNTGTGVVSAFKTGFEVARTDYIVPIMCDLSDMPETVNALYSKIQEGYDLVVASRYAPGGAKIGGPKIKLALSRIANGSLHRLSGIPTHDMTNAFIIYKREVLDDIHIESTGGFEITLELIAKAYILGYNISEVPTINRDRAAGNSKFKMLSWMGNYLKWYVYILRFSLLKRLGQPYQQNLSKKDSKAKWHND